MRFILNVLLLPTACHAIKIVLSNDDGWAEKQVRMFYSALNTVFEDVIMAAPAEDQSGTGSSDAEPTTVGEDGCEYASCPAGSPPYGFNTSDPRLNYVASYPVTSMKYGVQNLSKAAFDSMPDLAVSGPNVGSNLGLTTQISGTVGAACAAANLGIPAIAYSGASGEPSAWNTPSQPQHVVYAGLSTKIASTLVDSGKPYLPENIFLNVNYPEVTDRACPRVTDFSFILSRINYPAFSDDDVDTCGSVRLPTESDVIDTTGCFVSISVGESNGKLDANATTQRVVLEKLSPILSCLSSNGATPTFSTPSATSTTTSSSSSSTASSTSKGSVVHRPPPELINLGILSAVLVFLPAVALHIFGL